MKTKLCKCGKRLYTRNGVVVNKLCPSCRSERLKAKKDKHSKTKKGISERCRKLIGDNDKLYQQIGRKLYKSCYWCSDYSCLHHFIRKSQSLALRYDLKNGIPICQVHHTLIHQAQDSTLEAQLVLDKGKDWLDYLKVGKNKIIVDKLTFLEAESKRLKDLC